MAGDHPFSHATIEPAPTAEQAAAIMVALEFLTPTASGVEAPVAASTTWRFSGRDWNTGETGWPRRDW